MNQLAKIESQTLATRPAMDIESIFRLAIEKGGGVDTIERLMQVRKQLQEEAAKSAFDSALASFQAECPIIEKRKSVMNKGGQGVRYKYAPLDDIVLQVRVLLKKHGFSFSLDTQVEPGWVKAICKLTHEAGHSQLSEFKVPIDKDAFMNCQQQFASALTFAKRYAFTNALGILTGDEDIDGQTKREKPAGPSTLAAEPTVKEYAAELWRVLKPVRGTEKSWDDANGWLMGAGILGDEEEAPHFTPDRFKEIIVKAREQIRKEFGE